MNARARFGGVCLRCNRAYLTPHWPEGLCRHCYLGSLSAVDRAVALVSGGLK